MLASGQVAFDRPGNSAIASELALTGETSPVKGILSMALQAVAEGRDMPEINRKTLAVLRQPMEEGKVTIGRAMNGSTFPADFILVAAMNPCS